MAKFDSQKALDSSDIPNPKEILTHLLDNLSEKDNQSRSLTNRVVGIELRVNECERYSSEDSIIFDNWSPRSTSDPLNPSLWKKDFLHSEKLLGKRLMNDV